MAYIIANFDNFSNNLVARIGAVVIGKGHGRNRVISINKDQLQIAAADTRERIAHAHPVGCRKWLSW